MAEAGLLDSRMRHKRVFRDNEAGILIDVAYVFKVCDQKQNI